MERFEVQEESKTSTQGKGRVEKLAASMEEVEVLRQRIAEKQAEGSEDTV